MTFYFGTILLSVIGNSLVVIKISKDICNKDYKFNKRKKNKFDPIIMLIQLFLLSVLPICNLILSCILLYGADKFSKAYIKNAINYGTLVKKEKTEGVELDNNLVKDKVEVKQKQEITREEKIKFLREEYKRLTSEDVLDNVKPKQHRIDKRR